MKRRLRLRREVLAELTDEHLSAVVGGTTGTIKTTTAVETLQTACLSLDTCRSCQICTNDGAC